MMMTSMEMFINSCLGEVRVNTLTILLRILHLDIPIPQNSLDTCGHVILLCL